MTYNDDNQPTEHFDAPRNVEELEQYFKTYKFTPKEKSILINCYDEAFNTRGVPLAIGFGIFIHIGIRNGYLKPHRRFGTWPSILIGGACGLFLGVFSATTTCYDKLRMDEKSLYGRYLQHKKYGKYFFDYVPEKSRPNIDSGDSHSLNNKFSQPNVLNLDFERPDVKNVDEFRRFPNDDSMENMRDADQPKSFVTYEELRKKNRDAYAQTVESKYDRVTSEPISGDSMRRILRVQPKPTKKTEDGESVFGNE